MAENSTYFLNPAFRATFLIIRQKKYLSVCINPRVFLCPHKKFFMC